MKPFVLLIFLIIFPTHSFANEQTSTKEENTPKSSILKSSSKVWDKTKEYSKKKYDEYQKSKKSKENRSERKYQFNYAPVSFGLYYPIKSSIILNYQISHRHSLGFEYLSGGFSYKLSKIDLAEFKESLFLIPFKYYNNNNSFFWKYGIGIRKYKLSIGDDFLTEIAKHTDYDGIYSLDVLKVQNEVINLGIGNQWQWENGFSVGVDWFELFIPIGKGQVEESLSQHLQGEDKKNFEKLLHYLEREVSFTALKLKLGWAF